MKYSLKIAVSLVCITLLAILFVYALKLPYKMSTAEVLGHPLMLVGIMDIYIGIWFFICWVAHRERNIAVTLAWAVVFVVLGNIGTSLYVLYAALRSLKSEHPAAFWVGEHDWKE
eukprot:TRINITY_DN43_c0_g1_i1.p1 TRINITY_DN43_c0_g1~~TRINITY_DN43_c0_g1_i1.p1  ORF type:complete len:115 (+),score=28.11 TRINITY_DN43_c0_g1_i1:36-380(+)